MARRAIVGAALAAVLTSSVTLPHAEARGTSCDKATLAAGAAAGTVSANRPEEWWSFPGVPGIYLVTLVSSVADADLGAGDGACNEQCTKSVDLGPEACTIETTTNGVTAVARSKSHRLPASYVIEVTLLRAAALPDCVDGKDNDSDGAVDYGSDAGCGSALDPSEDDSPCYDVPSASVCVTPDTSIRSTPVTLVQPTFGTYEIAGYVDTYVFDVEGKKVAIPCVSLVVEPHGTYNACELASGTYVSRDRTLYKPVDTKAPDGTFVPLHVCPAEVTVTTAAAERTIDASTLC